LLQTFELNRLVSTEKSKLEEFRNFSPQKGTYSAREVGRLEPLTERIASAEAAKIKSRQKIGFECGS
jgi:hypothetical protein